MEAKTLFVVLSVAIAQGATCKVPSHPECFKKSTKEDEDFICEWKPADSVQNASYTLIMKNEDEKYHAMFQVGGALLTTLPLEKLILESEVQIWVLAHVGDNICNSSTNAVILGQSVKYDAPHINKIKRTSGNLTLWWQTPKDNEDAEHEIRYRKKMTDSLESWEKKEFETKDCKAEGPGTPFCLVPAQFNPYSVYEVQVRRKAKQVLSPLWSEWSPVHVVPLEIPNLTGVHWKLGAMENGIRSLSLTWDAPPDGASHGGVDYNLTLSIWPCETKHKTINATRFNINVTYSGAKVVIVAKNLVGSSPPRHIIIPPVEHLKNCSEDKAPSSCLSTKAPSGRQNKKPKKRNLCREWYQLTDGETRSSNVNHSNSLSINVIKKNMQEYVRYYHFVHRRKNKDTEPNTICMCPIYKKEGAPAKGPKTVVASNVTLNSAVVYWESIPVQEQRGFLIHYMICISGDHNTDCQRVPPSQTSYSFQNLTVGSQYTVQIAGETTKGLGPNNTVHIMTKFASSGDGLSETKWIIIISLSMVVALFTVMLSFIFRGLKSKLLPTIPSPVISESANYRPNNQEMCQVKEEVHAVILLQMQEQKEKLCQPPAQEESPLLEESQICAHEEEGRACLTDPSTRERSSSPLSPDYKKQMQRLSGPVEVTDKTHRENDSEVTTPTYRNGLFFEIKAESVDEDGTAL